MSDSSLGPDDITPDVAEQPAAVVSPAVETPVYAEPGARWRTVAYGPVLCLIVFVTEAVARGPVHVPALLGLGGLLAGISAIQVTAARQHVSMALTSTTLRNGAETLPVAEIAEVLPARGIKEHGELAWETARSLGELADVPRRRRPVGLRLRDGTLVRTWARDEVSLRAALTHVLAPDSLEPEEGE